MPLATSLIARSVAPDRFPLMQALYDYALRTTTTVRRLESTVRRLTLAHVAIVQYRSFVATNTTYTGVQMQTFLLDIVGDRVKYADINLSQVGTVVAVGKFQNGADVKVKWDKYDFVSLECFSNLRAI